MTPGQVRRRGIRAALVVLLLLVMSPAAAAEGDIELYLYPYSDAETQTLFSERPAGIAADMSFTLTSVEPEAQLEIAATDTEVVRAFTSVVYSGEVATCPARVWFSASSRDVRSVADGGFILVMSGSWQWNWTVRDAPDDPLCRRQYANFEAVSFEVHVVLQGGRPVATHGGGLPVPASAVAIVAGSPPVIPDGEGRAAPEPDDDGVSRIAFAVFVLLLLVALGAAWYFGLWHVLRHWAFGRSSTSPGPQSGSTDAPGAEPPPPPEISPSDPKTKTYVTAGETATFTTTVEAIPTAQLVPTPGSDHILGASRDGKQVTRFTPGTEVTVLSIEATRALIKYSSDAPTWVDRQNLHMTSTSPPTTEPKPPPPPPPPKER